MADETVFVKPTNTAKLNEETTMITGVTQEDIDQKGVTFEEAIKKVSKNIQRII
jgi:exonuclease I